MLWIHFIPDVTRKLNPSSILCLDARMRRKFGVLFLKLLNWWQVIFRLTLQWFNDLLLSKEPFFRLGVCVGCFLCKSRNAFVFEFEVLPPWSVNKSVLLSDLDGLLQPAPRPSSVEVAQLASLFSLVNLSSFGSFMMCDGAFDKALGSTALACFLSNLSHSLLDGDAKPINFLLHRPQQQKLWRSEMPASLVSLVVLPIQ